MPVGRFSQRSKDMFANELTYLVLPSEAGQSFTHDVDHRLGSPAVAPVVKERKSQHLAVHSGYVAREANNVIGGAGFGVEVSLRRCVSHPSLEELRVPGDRQRRVKPRSPGRPMRVAQQLDLSPR